MKRLLQFDTTENSYIILEAGATVFEIPFHGLRFDSRAFYQGIYSDGRSANIKFENIAGNTNAKIGYVFRWLNDIIQEIQIELGGEDDDERGALLEGSSGEDSVPETKTIILFDMGVCAGIGDFLVSQDSSGEPFETTELEADYALRISGHSMEPTLADGDIVLIKTIKEPIDGQIIVVNVDGRSMVKRYLFKDGRAMLIPDNKSGEFQSILLDDENSVQVQGLVISICNKGTKLMNTN